MVDIDKNAYDQKYNTTLKLILNLSPNTNTRNSIEMSVRDQVKHRQEDR